MRYPSTLIALLALIVGLTATNAMAALEPTYNVGLSETVETPASWIGTAAEMRYCGLFGSFSSTGGEKAIIFEGVDMRMLPDLTGYKHLQEVKLIARSTGGDRREYVVSKENMKNGIYIVDVTGLRPAEWIFTWEIRSKDKTRSYGVLFFRVNLRGERTTAASIHVTVQLAPADLYRISPQVAFGYTRGLIPAWPTMDLEYSQQMMLQSQLTTKGSTQVAPQPVAQPVQGTEQDYQSEPEREIVREEPRPEPIVGEAKLLLAGNDLKSFPVSIGVPLKTGDMLVFKRDGKLIAEAKVLSARPGEVSAKIVKGGKVRSGDDIFVREGK